MADLLSLQNHSLLAVGAGRRVYAHPENPAWLVKVIRPDLSRIELRRARWALHREISAYAEVRLHENGPLPFLQNLIGFARTDLGLGLVSVAARAASGDYAPTLKRLLDENRYDAPARAAFETFVEALLASRLVAADLNANNLVYAHTPALGLHFVLIDGLGDKTWIPLNRFSRFFNRRSKRRRLARLRRYIAVRLPPDSRAA